ncbi:MAG: hypothetical protein GKR94_11540 [Gammaproteobacteria bacterium]|nr:hypothetical protein [Gammaproteobacteria bacterium]
MSEEARPFRFYDNRQKYLSFVTTCNEKWKIAQRAIEELRHIKPTPPALRIFDAGMGDGTLLSHIMRASHKLFPTVPLYVVGKEISLEDIRLSLDKLPDRFVEHTATVVVFTNLYYANAPWLRRAKKDLAINWTDLPLHGNTAAEFGEQLRDLDTQLVDGWRVRPSARTGNPLYETPSVLVIYRADQDFVLNSIKPRSEDVAADFDLVLVSQPWRARIPAHFKVKNVLEPMSRALAPGGRALIAQSIGNDPGLELIRQIWPDEDPFQVTRHELIQTLKQTLGERANDYRISGVSDSDALLSYQMHTLPDEIQSSIGTSTLFAAWNAAIYVAQVEDERLEPVLSSGEYLEHTSRILRKYGGLWFNDEVFVIAKRARLQNGPQQPSKPILKELRP